MKRYNLSWRSRNHKYPACNSSCTFVATSWNFVKHHTNVLIWKEIFFKHRWCILSFIMISGRIKHIGINRDSRSHRDDWIFLMVTKSFLFRYFPKFKPNETVKQRRNVAIKQMHKGEGKGMWILRFLLFSESIISTDYSDEYGLRRWGFSGIQSFPQLLKVGWNMRNKI